MKQMVALGDLNTSHRVIYTAQKISIKSDRTPMDLCDKIAFTGVTVTVDIYTHKHMHRHTHAQTTDLLRY